MSAFPTEDMGNTFVVMIGKQIRDSLCRVLGDGVWYQWHENDDKTVIPDASINCNTSALSGQKLDS